MADSRDNGGTDWDPGSYGRFRGLRLRPALDLLMQVGVAPAGEVVDLGCGDGAVAPALRQRFPDRRIVGVDSSPAMLAEAQGLVAGKEAAAAGGEPRERAAAFGQDAREDACSKGGSLATQSETRERDATALVEAHGYDVTVLADIATWVPDEAPAVIYSNAALQWVGDHVRLFPRLAGLLPPGGWLAVQMPRQEEAPSHRLLRDVAEALWPGRIPQAPPRVGAPEVYARLLQPFGPVSVWETRYLQRLDPVAEGHPVRHFTASTAMRPFADGLDADERARFVAAYDAALAEAYPAEADGGVFFPFLRLFMVVQKG